MSGAANSDRRAQLVAQEKKLLGHMEAAISSLEEAIEDVVENSEVIAGRCETCSKLLFDGDQGHVCVDGDPKFCAEHAYSWADVKESYECDGGLRDTDRDAYDCFIRRMDKHIASGGNPEDKILHVL
mgnify:CR=1 FL=1